MSLYRAEAVVLRSQDFGEADKLLTLYSRYRGKLRAVARGARRPRSRFVGAAQVFTHCVLLLFEGKSLDTVSQCEIRESFAGLREDLTRMAYATYVVELVDELVGERDVHEDLFTLLLTTLHLLNSGQEQELVLKLFELRLLSVLGYRPRLDSCVSCNQRYGREGNAYARFSAVLGGVLCSSCHSHDPGAIRISWDTLGVMRELLTADPRRALSRKLPRELAQELERVVRGFISSRLDKPLRSLAFLDMVRFGDAWSEVAAAKPACNTFVKL